LLRRSNLYDNQLRLLTCTAPHCGASVVDLAASPCDKDRRAYRRNDG
jgi:hypothetical protein